MKKRTYSKGFTLIELLVVVAIIALLLSILLPGLKMAKSYAKRVLCAARFRQVGVTLKVYSDANDDMLPDDHNIDGDRERHAYAVYRSEADKGFILPNGKPKPLRYAYLYEQDYIQDPEIFYCPGNNPLYAEAYVYKNYIKPAPWGMLPQDFNTETSRNQWVRIGYLYYPIAKDTQLDPVYQAPKELATKYIQINTNLPIASDIIHSHESIAHQYGGKYALEFLYPDGHVVTCVNQDLFNNLLDPFGNNLWRTLDSGNLPNDTDYYDTAYYTVFRSLNY